MALNMRWSLANGHPLNDNHLDYLASKLYGGQCYLATNVVQLLFVENLERVLCEIVGGVGLLPLDRSGSYSKLAFMLSIESILFCRKTYDGRLH